ncbi:endonuclease-3 [Halopenitus malekzadehii]|uniref:Endonuclease-3 n=1 Tax=Halopenitus malekzadehii TaxID=1267564 RepID=A0A1H6IE11_9EURY|nr:GIY-YIG nuclease family protein [Halopenitus malekzadehii]SEH46969.1 endonuclease-3 [Halopenitus malekzadehii]
MPGGTYTLVLAVPTSLTIEVGALGDHDLPAGGYAYTGSALGSGGFARVDRHRDIAAGERDTRHWHIDYLLGHPAVRIADVVRTGGLDVECAIADRLGNGPVPGFGASDCDCESHLARRDAVDTMVAAVEDAHDRLAAKRSE